MTRESWIRVCVGMALSVAVLCSGCTAGPAAIPTGGATPRPTPLPQPTPAPEPTGEPAPPTAEELLAMIGGELLGEARRLVLDHQGHEGRVFVEWELAASTDNEQIVAGAKQDTVTILRTICQSNLDYLEVRLSAWYTITVDINANTAYTELLDLRYDRATLEELNWETVRSQFIWFVADGGSLHWLLEE